MTATVTLQLPDPIYQRLVNTANATGRSLEEVMLHALKVGSPPDWENAPDEFKADLAALDRLEDEALWKVATGHKTEEEMHGISSYWSVTRNILLLQQNRWSWSNYDCRRIFSCYGKPMLLLFYVGVVTVFLIPDCLCLPIFLNL